MRILAFTPNQADACSFYRCIGPLTRLAKTYDTIHLEAPKEKDKVDWAYLSQFDVLYLHRPYRREEATLVQIAKECGVPVWIDYDDWLFDIPDWNKAREVFHQPDAQRVMAWLGVTADVVSVTTHAMAERYLRINPNVNIIPNAFDEALFPFMTDQMPERFEDFAWRGGVTHEGDVGSIASALKEIPGLTTFGVFPEKYVKDLVEPRRVPPLEMWQYFKTFYYNAPRFLIVPLADVFFNHCKSHCAWLEATRAGAMTIAPDMKEWKIPGVLTYKAGSAQSFASAIKHARDLKEAQRFDYAQLSFAHLKNHYTLAKVNETRMAILRALKHPSFRVREIRADADMMSSKALTEIKRA